MGDRLEAGEAFKATKEWAGFVFSAIAVAISITSFILSNVRQSDDLSVVVSGILSAKIDTDGDDKFSLKSLLTASFVNAGTRSIVIQKIAFWVAQEGDFTKRERNNCNREDAIIEFKIDPIVVKSQEVGVVALRDFESIDNRTTTSDGRPVIKFVRNNAESNPMLVCLAFIFIVPEHPVKLEVMEVMAGNMTRKKAYLPQSMRELVYTKQPPTQLFREKSYSLFR